MRISENFDGEEENTVPAYSVAPGRLHRDRRQRRTGHGDRLADLPKMQSDPRCRGWRFYAYTSAPAPQQQEYSYDTPGYSARHDAFTDNNELQQRIDDMNTSIAATSQAISAATEAQALTYAAAANQ